MGRKDAMQGEGDRESARRFNKDQQEFVNSPAGRKAVRDVQEQPRDENDELRQAEAEAAARARETDPAVTRDYDKPAAD